MAVVTPPGSEILFYKTGSDYDLFSNATKVAVNMTLNGVQFSASSSEAVFQGLKGLTSVTPETRDKAAALIRTDKVGAEVQRMGGRPTLGGVGVMDLSGDTPPMVYDRPYISNPPDPPVPSGTTVKEQVMYELLLAKATQNPQVLKALIDTGDRPITEDTSKKPLPTGRAVTEADDDRTWGNGWTDAQRKTYGLPDAPGPGGNALGRAWMRARDTLRAELNDTKSNGVRVRAGLSDPLAKALGHTAHVPGSQYASTPPITAKDLADLPRAPSTGGPIKQVADLDSAYMAQRKDRASSMSMGADPSESAKAASGLGKGATPPGATAPGGSAPSIAVGTPGGKAPSIGVATPGGKAPSIAVGAPGRAAPSIGVPMPGKKGIELTGEGEKEVAELMSGEGKKKEEDKEKFEGGDLTWEKWFERIFSGVINAGAKFVNKNIVKPLQKYVGAPIEKFIVDPAKAWVNNNVIDPVKSRFNKYIANPISRFFKAWENLGKKTSSETEAPSESKTTKSEASQPVSTAATASVAAQHASDLKQVDADTRERQEAGEGLKHGETGSTPAFNADASRRPGVHKMNQDMDQAEKERKAQEEVKIESDHQTPKIGGH